MKETQTQFYMIKGIISTMPELEQAQINKCIAELKDVGAKYPLELYVLALGCYGLEIQMEYEKQ